MRTFLLTGKMIYPGPFIVKQDRERCLGPDACGQCVKILPVRRKLGPIDRPRGREEVLRMRAVRAVCRGQARELVGRARYAHEKVIPAQALLEGHFPSRTPGPAA